MGAAVFDRLVDGAGVLLGGPAAMFVRYVLASVVFVVVAAALRRLPPAARVWGQVVTSIVLIGAMTTPVVVAMMALYAIVFFWVVEYVSSKPVRALLVVVLLAVQVVAPIFWLPRLPEGMAGVRAFVAFATNATFLRSWGYAYDRLRRPAPERPALRDYALFTFFFPAFVNGPLVSISEFQRARLASYWDEQPAAGAHPGHRPGWIALGRVGAGAGAMIVAFLFVWAISPSAYHAAARGPALTAWSQALSIYLCWYLSFWGWSEAAIGFGQVAGIRLPENFTAPHVAYGTADFWRRWNMTFNRWLGSYVYLPLGGAYLRGRSGERHLEWRNTAAVFGVVAAYHVAGGMKLLGLNAFTALAAIPWLLWAAANTVAVLATRTWQRPARWRIRDGVVVVLTLAVNCAFHMTAVFPPSIGLLQLGAIYRRLLFL